MTHNTIFDVASLTKVTVTLPLILQLAERGCLSLGDAVSLYLPEFSGGLKDRVTLAHLLTHSGGLVPHREYFRTFTGYDRIVRAAAEQPLEYIPGQRVVYSDLGFILLGEIVQRVRNQSLAESAQEEIFDVVGMVDAGYRPAEHLNQRIAATEIFDGRAQVGIVHDDNTQAMGGESGHAGLFATVFDLGLYLQTWVDPKRSLLKWSTREASIRLGTIGLLGRRGLGWVLRGDTQDMLGDFWPETAASHTGFTGTSMGVDLKTGIWCVLLTNRVHFGRAHDISAFRRHFHNLVVTELT